ncbi:hypothetical protein RLIN73S_05850 [Rhodanobacter lindaniclasticus]
MSASVKPQARDAIWQIAGVLAPLGVAYDASRPGGGGSDLSQMHARGMAALGLTQDGTRYFDWHHTANDTLDKIDPAELAQNVAVYAAWVYMAAQAEGDFGSAPGRSPRTVPASEFESGAATRSAEPRSQPAPVGARSRAMLLGPGIGIGNRESGIGNRESQEQEQEQEHRPRAGSYARGRAWSWVTWPACR